MFSKLNLRSEYLQVQVTERDIVKTAFRTKHKYYKVVVMPFMLTNEQGVLGLVGLLKVRDGFNALWVIVN